MVPVIHTGVTGVGAGGASSRYIGLLHLFGGSGFLGCCLGSWPQEYLKLERLRLLPFSSW
ncbi:hypothetical protein [Desulfotomaculum nigrificans]|uniref:hypothetical protein n=1 Tax=Desulfotomaculum nigrificans TaxID=1565 RepID=UPI0012DBFF87|nr:hypothetical protein [Desulfotomaculum nigrificans]